MSFSFTASFSLSKGIGPDFDVVDLEGEEAVSRPYRFSIGLLCGDAEVDPAALLLQRGVLEIDRCGSVRRFGGVVLEAEHHGLTADDRALFRIVLAPRVALLERSVNNRVFCTTQPRSIVEIARMLLTGHGLDGPGADEGPRLGDADLEFRLSGEHEALDYVVQYAEDDLAFLSRLLADGGLFYFFDQRGDDETVVIADSNAGFDRGPTVPFRAGAGMVDDEATITAFAAEARLGPQSVIVQDYNYRLPKLYLRSEGTVDPHGVGIVHHFGARHLTPEAGGRLAQLRADALACRRLSHDGASTDVTLRPGVLVALSGHARPAFDRRYLVETVRHVGSLFRVHHATLQVAGRVDYRNTFRCLRDDTAYRPERPSEQPVLPGVINAHVEGERDGRRAEIDEEGRYKVRVPFDLGGAPAAKASRYLRRSQPYGGSGVGMHLPLLPGAEVILLHRAGHPDRPMIGAALPNALHPSVVTGSESQKNRIKSPSGITIEMGDGAGSAGSGDTADGATLATEQAASNGDDFVTGASGNDTVYAYISVPDFDAAGDDAYLRLGAATGASPETDYIAATAAQDTLVGSEGFFDYTVGNRLEIAKEGRYDRIQGSATVVVDSVEGTTVAGSRSRTVGKSSALAVAGDRNRYVTGAQTERLKGTFTESITGTSDVTIGGDHTESIVGSAEVSVGGAAYSETIGGTLSETDWDRVSYSGTFEDNHKKGSSKEYNKSSESKYYIGLKNKMTYGTSTTTNYAGEIDFNFLATSLSISTIGVSTYVFKLEAGPISSGYAGLALGLGLCLRWKVCGANPKLKGAQYDGSLLNFHWL